ncbi:DUF927 domain-containing protein [Rhizobium laguerreae]|uniref:DUF927 domain-containing protein n=1 Tax=Rhizobium laguerreae TaxID=1076926 RepID=UPI001C9094E7|nr:DUF927 domain-containing protein [Rhizobium laguerreae]MBY3486123.1 DUF927 domain-containing protein [Rhizobium laguerreae]
MKQITHNKVRIQIADNVTIEGQSATFAAVRAQPSNASTVTIFLRPSKLLHPNVCAEALLDGGLRGLYETKELASLIVDAKKKIFAKPLHIATTSGWHGTKYIFNGKAFGADDTIRWEPHPDLKTYQYPLDQDRTLFVSLAKMSKTYDFLAFAMMLAFAGPLLAMLDKTERPAVHIWGPSRSGKTTLLKILNALIHPPTNRNLAPFNFTRRGLEEILARGNGQLVCFDELGTLKDSELEEILGTLPYLAGNGRGRIGSQGGGLSESFPNLEWSTIPVITGEKNLQEFQSRKVGTGQDARLLVLPVPSDLEGGILAAKPQKTAEEYLALIEKLEEEIARYNGNDYEKWIKYITKNRSAILKKFKADVQKFTSRFAGPSASNLDRDIALKFAWFAACGQAMRRANIIAWPKERAEEVAHKFYDIDMAEKRSSSPRFDGEQKGLARVILARIACAHIKAASPPDCGVSDNEALATLEDTTRGKWIIIEKSHVQEAFDSSPQQVVQALRSVPGLLVGRPNSPFYQDRSGGKTRSVLKLDYRLLVSTAFPSASRKEIGVGGPRAGSAMGDGQ